MMLGLYACYDNKAGFYRFPMWSRTRGEAIRAVVSAGSDVQSELGKFPTDFVLFEIGFLDDVRGVFVAEGPPLNLGLVASLLPAPTPTNGSLFDIERAASEKH